LSSAQPARTNASTPAQRSQVVTLLQASSSQFQEAENVVVHDGQFTNGNVVNNITINLPERKYDIVQLLVHLEFIQV
jgi:hypothetical protein